MRGFCSYLYMQWKRSRKLLPALLGVTLFTCVCLGVFGTNYLREGALGEGQKKYRVGIVGDTTDSYLGFGISLVSVMDDSRFMVELPEMTEEEARRAMAEGELTAYALIPQGLVDSIVYGANDRPITIVGSTGQKGLVGFFVEELAEMVSTLVVRSQSAIFGMQNILSAHGMGDVWLEATDKLNLRLIDLVLDRGRLLDLTELGLAGGLSTGGYYLCSMLVFFLLLAGIHSSPLFGARSRELMRLLSARGIGAAAQVAGEYLAYLALNVICLLGVFLVLSPVLGSGALPIPEWRDGQTAAALFWCFVLVAAVLSAMQFFLYELVSGVVNGVLLQFLTGIGMAYLSGCFYPVNLFPEGLKRLGQALPAGVALSWADKALTGSVSFQAAAGLLIYLAVFFGGAVLVRRCRIERG